MYSLSWVPGHSAAYRSLSWEFDLSWTVKTHSFDRWEAAEQLREMFKLTGAPRCKPLDQWADISAILVTSAAAWWWLLLIWHHRGRHVEQYEDMDWRLFHSSQSSWSWPDWIAVTVDGFEPWSSSPDSSFTQEPNNSTGRTEWWIQKWTRWQYRMISSDKLELDCMLHHRDESHNRRLCMRDGGNSHLRMERL